jgi:methylated-DNA-[protein]-cysteine S-methyltransferase
MRQEVPMSRSTHYSVTLKTPVGTLGVVTAQGAICALDFPVAASPVRVPGEDLALEVVRQLRHYFDDGGARFTLPLRLSGTDFQRAVWKCLQAIPPGVTRTYGEIARELHSSPRAVGNACRANPVPIVIPCHRVVSANGIGGYGGATSGKRLKIKRWLLEHEGVR